MTRTRHGMYLLSEADVHAVEEWIGEQIDCVTTTYTPGGWDTWRITFGDDDDELQRVFGDTDRNLVIHTPLTTGDGHDYRPAANGEYDSEYRAFAEQLVNLGMGDSAIRVAAEFNRDWSSRLPNDPTNYASGFARLVREMQSVEGANFDFLFSPSGTPSGIEWDAWPPSASEWPEGEDPPLITVGSPYDAAIAYGRSGCSSITDGDREDAWEENFSEILEWYDFADDVNGVIGGTVEWGLSDKEWNDFGGCDNPYVIERMVEQAHEDGWKYLAYWNADSSAGGTHKIFPVDESPFPDGAERYRQLVGEYLATERGDAEDGDDSTDEEESGQDDEHESSGLLFDDWTPAWRNASENDWSIVSGDEYTGGHALVFEHDGDERTRYALACDRLGTLSDFESLDKFRVPEFTPDSRLGFHARVYFRASGGAGAENGYWVEVENRNDTFRLAKYTDGSITNIERFGTPEENTFFYRRIRAEGEQLQVKIWPADEAEPSDWDVETNDDDHAEGWIGLGSLDTGAVETDVFSVGVDGDAAPFPTDRNRLAVDTLEPAAITSDGLTLTGELTELEGYDEAVVGFEWGEADGDFPHVTDGQTLDAPGTFSAELTDLEPDQAYEYRAVAVAGDETVRSDPVAVTTEADNPGGPVIDAVEVSDSSDDTWTRFDVDWTVSHKQGELDTVVTKLRRDGVTVAAETENVFGSAASFTHAVRVRGEIDEVRLVVSDTSNDVTVETIEV